MTAIAMGSSAAAAGALFFGPLKAHTVTFSSVFVKTDATATAALRFASGGGLDTTGSLGSSSSVTPAIDSNEWANGRTPSDYEIRVDAQTGSFSSGTTGSYLALSTSRSWNISRVHSVSGTGTSTVTFRVRIRRASDSAVVYDSDTIGTDFQLSATII